MRDSGTAFGVCVIVVLLVAFVWALGCAGRSAQVERWCLRHGWAGAQIDWTWAGYCTARVDQTDIVRPWKEAEAR